jgi:hypothetical protein
MRFLWQLEGGREGPCLLQFSPGADAALQDFERWLEPQLAPGEDLSLLAGWANKLAGACARLAGILHCAEAAGEGQPPAVSVSRETVERAVQLGRDYLLPHAQAAFALMGADERLEKARRAWENIRRRVAHSAHSADTPLTVSRRDLHNWNRRGFPTVEELDPVIGVLVDHYYLRLPPDPTGLPGRGHKSPLYEVNPKALTATEE